MSFRWFRRLFINNDGKFKDRIAKENFPFLREGSWHLPLMVLCKEHGGNYFKWPKSVVTRIVQCGNEHGELSKQERQGGARRKWPGTIALWVKEDYPETYADAVAWIEQCDTQDPAIFNDYKRDQ